MATYNWREGWETGSSDLLVTTQLYTFFSQKRLSCPSLRQTMHSQIPVSHIDAESDLPSSQVVSHVLESKAKLSATFKHTYPHTPVPQRGYGMYNFAYIPLKAIKCFTEHEKLRELVNCFFS